MNYKKIKIPRDWKIDNKGYFGMLGAVGLGLGLYFVWLEALAFPPPDSIVDDPFVAELLGHNLTEVQLALKNSYHWEEVPPEIRLTMRGKGVSFLGKTSIRFPILGKFVFLTIIIQG